jgi:Carboxypeptidase regulatory-like domain
MGVYNRSMRNRDRFLRTWMVSAVLLASLAASALAAPMTKINIVLKDQAGKPVDHASVVVRFVQGHSVVKLGKAIRTTFELRSNQEGEARIPSIPQGKIRVQVIAKGYQTFGQIFDITEEEKTLDITLNPPQQQYTAH